MRAHWQMITNEHTYDVGQVKVETNGSHSHRLRILKMTMENWNKNKGMNYSEGDDITQMYNSNLNKVKILFERLETNVVENLSKDQMIEMNKLFKRYGGKRDG